MNNIKVRICPICRTPAPSAIDIFRCWDSHDPGFWDRTPRAAIANTLGCSGPRTTQIIQEFTGNRKKYVKKES